MIKICCHFVGTLLSYILPLRTPIKLRALGSHLYTGFARRRFASFGKGSLIGWPISDIVGALCIHVGNDTEISTGVILSAWPNRLVTNPILKIGDHCHIGARNHFSAALRIEIGNNLLTGPNVLILDNAHGNSERHTLEIPPSDRPLTSKGEVRIGHNVWLGTNVCVLPGVHIGDGVIVAAGSVVTHDLPSYCVAAGVPAQIIKQYK